MESAGAATVRSADAAQRSDGGLVLVDEVGESFEDAQSTADLRSSSISWFVAAVAVIALISLAVLAALYYVFVNNKQRVTKPNKRRSVIKWVWLVVALVAFMVVGSLLAAVCLGIMRIVERKKLFLPTRISTYRRVQGKWYPLPSGGGLLNVTPDADPRTRRICFLGGQSYNLDAYAAAIDRFASQGFDTWCLEYGGFGAAPGPPGGPSAASVLQDAKEAWAICGRSDAILVGFSLGGGVVGQIYDNLTPLPQMVVFLNTMWSIPALLADKLGSTIGPVIAPLIETQWVTRAPKRFRGRVLVVFCSNDNVVPPQFSAELCRIFSESGLKPQCIELPEINGRSPHRASAITYMSAWCDALLPP